MKNFWKISIKLISGLAILSLMGCKKPTEPQPVEYPEYFHSPILVEAGQGRYLTVWTHYLSGSYSTYALMIDENGNKLWEQEISIGSPVSAIRTSDGYFLVGGQNSSQFFIVKIYNDGTIIWSKTYNKGGGLLDIGNGKILVTAPQKGTMLLDYNGELLKTYGNGGYGVVKSSDMGIIMIEVYNAALPPFVNWKYDRLVKLNQNLDLVWRRIVMSPDDTTCIRLFSIGKVGEDYVAIGQIVDCIDERPQGPIYLVRFDESGNIILSKIISGINNLWSLYSAVIDNDGIYAMIDVLRENYVRKGIIRIDFEGNVLWQRDFETFIYGRIGIIYDGVVVFLRDYDNVFTNHLIKISFDGNILWERSFENSQTGAIGVASDGNYIVLLEDLRFVKISPSGEIIIDRKL